MSHVGRLSLTSRHRRHVGHVVHQLHITFCVRKVLAYKTHMPINLFLEQPCNACGPGSATSLDAKG